MIDNASLSLIGTTQNRALRIQTLPGQTGLAGITVEVANLGGLTASADFSVSVIPRSPPLINFGQGESRIEAPQPVIWSRSICPFQTRLTRRATCC